MIGSLKFLTNSIHPEAKFTVQQFARFGTDSKLLHNQALKRIIKHLKGTATQGLILKPDPEKWIERYVDVNFSVGWNQDKGMELVLVISRTGYVITYANYPITWASRLQKYIILRTTEA